MIWIIIAIGLAILGFGLFGLYNFRSRYENLMIVASVVGGLIAFTGLVVMIALISTSAWVIDEEIQIYTEQNAQIEAQVATIVEAYQFYEKDTYIQLKPEDNPIAFASVYPELKSDELVKERIALYTENNKKITELKVKKANQKIINWWLFFGD